MEGEEEGWTRARDLDSRGTCLKYRQLSADLRANEAPLPSVI